MDYRVFTVTCTEEFKDIFIAELAEIGFDTMQETETGIEAFSENNQVEESATTKLLKRYAHTGVVGEWNLVANTNWNEEWEKNYEPVIVEDKCLIRANFHQVEGKFDLEIVINPRMSFGTGHHATTYLMVQAALNHNFTDKEVLDAGCGTGILAIVAEKKGASHIDAYDVSQLCVDNTIDNVAQNGCDKINVFTGTVTEVPLKDTYDIIFANINKNVLLDELPEYKKLMKSGTYLLLSGFFEADGEDILAKALSIQMKLVSKYVKNGWACLVMEL